MVFNWIVNLQQLIDSNGRKSTTLKIQYKINCFVDEFND